MNIDKSIVMQINQIAKCFDQIEKVVLFGSRVRGDHRERSDIDLAIYAEGNISAFIDEVEMKVRTLLEFDFSNMKEVDDPFFKEQVEIEGVVLYEKP